MATSRPSPSLPGPTHQRSSRAGPAPLSTAMRRIIRQHVALATEMNVHSVAINGAVWTIRREALQEQHQRRETRQRRQDEGQRRADAEREQPQGGATSRRKERSHQRLMDFRAATRHRLKCCLQAWKRATRPRKAAQALATLEQAHSKDSSWVEEQHDECMGEKATKRGASSSARPGQPSSTCAAQASQGTE